MYSEGKVLHGLVEVMSCQVLQGNGNFLKWRT